jgi:hypothetical protein
MASPIRLTFWKRVVGGGDQTIEFLCRLLCKKPTFLFEEGESLPSWNFTF